MSLVKIVVGSLGRFPPEDSPIATYTKSLNDSLKRKCKVVTIGWGNSDSDYKIRIDKNFTKDLEKIAKREKIDVLHLQYITSSKHFAQNNKFAWLNYFNTILAHLRLLKALDSLQIPKVVTLHELNTQSKDAKKSIVRFLERKVIEKADKVIVHSPIQKKFLLDRKVDAEYIGFGLNPVNVKKMGGKNLLYLGTLHPDRGVDYLVRAMELLPDYKLVVKGVVADQNYAVMIEKDIKENGLRNVQLQTGWGTKEERDKLYRWSDVVVLPYLWAPNQSAALHNAFAYRIPVVVTNTKGPIDETVDEFKCGVIVEMKNPEKLAEGVKEVYKNYKFYVKNVDRYRKISNWKTVADKHIETYNKLIETSV